MTRTSFLDTCKTCSSSMQAFCHRICKISFNFYHPKYPGYIPLIFCPDGRKEKVLPIEASSYKSKPGHTAPETMEERKLTILDYLDGKRTELVTSSDVQSILDIGHRHTTHLLSLMVKNGQIARHKAGNKFYYTLPEVKPNLSNASIGEQLRTSIVEALKQGPLTTPQIRESIGTRASLDIVRNQVYRLERDGVVRRLGGHYAKIWSL